MTLEAYLARPGAMSMTDLAAKLGITKGRLSQLKKDGNWSPELALLAESKTGGALDASVLSPIIAQARQTGVAA